MNLDHAFVDESNTVEKALTILKVDGNLALVGETGTGKDFLVHYLANTEGWILYEYPLTRDTSVSDLVASIELVNGSTVVREKVIANWLKDKTPGKKKTLFINEFNNAETGVTVVLQSVTDDNRELYIPETGETLERTEDHYIIIAMNPCDSPGYPNVFLRNIASVRRFSWIRLEYLSATAELTLLDQFPGDYPIKRRLVDFANRARNSYMQNRISIPITTANLIKYLKFLADGLAETDIHSIVLDQYPDEERGTVDKLLEVKQSQGGQTP